jgi:hypothetical protein
MIFDGRRCGVEQVTLYGIEVERQEKDILSHVIYHRLYGLPSPAIKPITPHNEKHPRAVFGNAR